MKTVDLLTQMRVEQREDHKTLVDKLDVVTASINTHVLEDTKRFSEFDTRLVPVEGLRRTLRWAVGAMFIALATGFVDFVVNHLHSHVK